MCGLIENLSTIQALFVFAKLDKLKTIRGTNLYILFSDLCEMDLNKIITLLNDCPGNILEDACNRQDRSGKKIVDKYLN